MHDSSYSVSLFSCFSLVIIYWASCAKPKNHWFSSFFTQCIEIVLFKVERITVYLFIPEPKCCRPLSKSFKNTFSKSIIVIIIIIIIIILVITFMQVIYNYMPETNHVSRVYGVAAVPYLQFVLHIMLFHQWNVVCTFTLALYYYFFYFNFYFYTTTTILAGM